jgi:hypothetical protein
MIIPNKHSGYQAGIRKYYMGGGGGGGVGSASPVAADPPPPSRMASAAPPPQFQTYGSGDRTGSLVQSGNSLRPSALDYSKPIYDPNYSDNITGYQKSSQFSQPIYQQQSTNYANPLTAFNVSNYGTNPGMSQSMQAATAPGGGGADAYYKHLQGYGSLLSGQGDRNNVNTLTQDMRKYGISAQDLQNASSYTPQQNNLQNAYEYNPQNKGSGVPFNQIMSQFGGFGGFGGSNGMYQMQTPFNPYTNSNMQGRPMNFEQQSAGTFPQQQMQQRQQQYSTQTSPMQQPFNPNNQQLAQPYQPPVQRASSGPNQAIVSRSAQMRGTPNVMRRAQGGIASLID